MLSIDIVAETYPPTSAREWWTDAVDPKPFIRLWAGISDAEAAALIIAIATQSRIVIESNFADVARRIAREETLILDGGLRIQDGTHIITMGCCCGIEDWRHQTSVFLNGGWLGHDPAPWLERKEEHVRVWSDGAMGPATTKASYVDVPKSTIAVLSKFAELELTSWLGAMKRWAELAIGSELAEKLATRIDEAFQIRQGNGGSTVA